MAGGSRLSFPQVRDKADQVLSSVLVSISRDNFRSNNFSDASGELVYADLVGEGRGVATGGRGWGTVTGGGERGVATGTFQHCVDYLCVQDLPLSLSLHSQSPGQYYVKPLLREYEFEPSSKV